VEEISNGNRLGYVSKDLNVDGSYVLDITDEILNLLVVQGTASMPQAQFTALNQPDSLKSILALSRGISSIGMDLGPDSSNYCLLTGVNNATEPGQPPYEFPTEYPYYTSSVFGSETPIWYVDPVTFALTPTWINTDSQEAQGTSLVVKDSTRTIALTGDIAGYNAMYYNGDTSPVREVQLYIELTNVSRRRDYFKRVNL
jgi:hypothetical protein